MSEDPRKADIGVTVGADGHPFRTGAKRTLPAPDPDTLRHRDDDRDDEERPEEDVVDAMERRRRRG